MHPVEGGAALKVTIRLFASYKEKAGRSTLELELANGATVGTLAEEVRRLFPTITQNPSRLVVAVNEEYRGHDHTLNEGDEVALIPPVSGGR